MNKYDAILNEMPSIKKIYEEVNAIYIIRGGMNSKMKQEVEKQKIYWDDMIDTLYKYNKYFSDNGWIIYGNLNIEFAKECIKEYEEKDIDSAEEKILNYYLNNDDNRFYFKSLLFKQRLDLLNQGLEAHFSNDFYKSIPIFLIIADSVVNEYTVAKGFFSDNVDLSCWDSLTGLSSGLEKLKEIYNKSRKKVNYEEIRMPYRNGILHGRDLNFANKYVSCKLLVLLLALDNWILDKKSEESRKEKFVKESNPPSISESMKKLEKNKRDRELIKSYKKKEYTINVNFPESGNLQDYKEFDFLKPIINFYELWKTKNYGFMAKQNDKLFYGKNVNEKIESCKELFASKKVNSFRIINVDDWTIAMKKIQIEFNYEEYNKTIKQIFEVGVIFYHNDEIVIPGYDEGEWKISFFNERRKSDE